MLLQRAMIVSAMAVVMQPQSLVLAQDAAPGAPLPVMEAAPSTAGTASAEQLAGIVFHARPGGLVYKLDARDPPPLTEEFRFDFAHRPVLSAAAGIRLAPALTASRTGWAVSGRAGPLRWLTPLDGETSTVMRFGGRIADQPRTPGLGKFNLSIHYAFE